jgi:hypothetical protein
MMQTVVGSYDLGNGFAKSRTAQHIAVFQSVIAQVGTSIDFKTGYGSEDFIIEYNGKVYAIGEDTVRRMGLVPVTIQDRSRIEVLGFYLPLFAAAMAATVKKSAEVHPVMSLPPGAYVDRDDMKRRLAGEHVVGVFTKEGKKNLRFTVPEANIRVIPEGMGAICSLVLNEDGRDDGKSELFRQTVGVVDGGTYTTDLLGFDKLALMQSATRSYPMGLNMIHRRIQSYAASIAVDLLEHELDPALQNGYIMKGGKRIPIGNEIDAAVREIAVAVDGYIRSLWRGANNMEVIILTGGLAPWIYPYLFDAFGDRVILADRDNPHFSNCEGGYRYGLLRERGNK